MSTVLEVGFMLLTVGVGVLWVADTLLGGDRLDAR